MGKMFNLSYNIQYSTNGFKIGHFDVEDDNIENVKKQAMHLLMKKLEENFDCTVEGYYLDNIISINIEINEIIEL